MHWVCTLVAGGAWALAFLAYRGVGRIERELDRRDFRDWTRDGGDHAR